MKFLECFFYTVSSYYLSMNIVAFLLTIIFIFYVIKLKIDKIKFCNWKPVSSFYDKERETMCKEYMKFINSLDLFYFIGFGSLLGAVRNEGLIKNDADIDIVLPISRNYKLFKCRKNINITNSEYNSSFIYLSTPSTLCKHSRSYYSKMLYDYVINHSKKFKLIKTRYNPIVMAFYIYKNLYVDIYPIIANEWLSRDFGICKCKFCGKYTYCNNDAFTQVKKIYGDDFLQPQNKKSNLTKRTIYLTLYE